VLSVAVHKDVAEYQPKIIGKLTGRTLASIAAALGAGLAVGGYMYFVLGISSDVTQYFVFAVTLPFWCMGFMRPKGMAFEKFVPLWIQHNFTDNRLFYTSSIYRVIGQDADEKEISEHEHISKSWEKLRKTNGIEAWAPSRSCDSGQPR
jgi:hypothetical protein